MWDSGNRVVLIARVAGRGARSQSWLKRQAANWQAAGKGVVVVGTGKGIERDTAESCDRTVGKSWGVQGQGPARAWPEK